MPPRKFWNLDAWKCNFQSFPDSIWALRTIKIKAILTIFYVYFNCSFPQNLHHWLLEKSEIKNLQMLIQKNNTFNVLSSCCSLKKETCSAMTVCWFLWHGRHFGTHESVGSSPVKMSQAFCDPSIFFNFLYFHRKVNTFKTPEMCLYLGSDVWVLCSTILLFFWGLFIILSQFLLDPVLWKYHWRFMTLRSTSIACEKGEHV